MKCIHSNQGKNKRQKRIPWSTWLFFSVVTSLFMLRSTSVTDICPQNQTAELGEQGRITCNFPDDLRSVYWFDGVSDNSSALANFQADSGVKSGPGFESGDYDVLQNGALVILNVTTWHERKYKVIVYRNSAIAFETYLVSLKVIGSPEDQFPKIGCHNCYQEYYYSVLGRGTLTCSFGAARPPVQLEWFEQRGDGYEHVEMQQFHTAENSNGTFDSSVTLQPLTTRSSLIHLVMCRSTWPQSDWRREKEILLDYSSHESFAGLTPQLQHMEINRYAKIKCGMPSSAYIIWKRILPNSEPEVIAFHSHEMTDTIGDIPDVEVSAEGSLIFSSPRIHHEGIYACIYGEGQKERIQMTSVELLIPPSPPYIWIQGCNNASQRCLFKEKTTPELTCAVYGGRPIPTLEWTAKDPNQISFHGHSYEDETSDTTLTVRYNVSADILCGEEIHIWCQLYGPLSKIMKADSMALVIPESCSPNEVRAKHGHGGIVGAVVILYIVVPAICVYLWFRQRKRAY